MRARVASVLILGCLLTGAGLVYYVTSTSTGTVAIRIHDTPSTWSHLTIAFAGVSIHPAGAAVGTWVALNLSAPQLDFLALDNLTALLALDRVAPGAYSAIRLGVLSVQGVLSSGEPVIVPVSRASGSAATSFVVLGGGRTTITLDLDLSQSITQPNGIWTFALILGATSVG